MKSVACIGLSFLFISFFSVSIEGSELRKEKPGGLGGVERLNLSKVARGPQATGGLIRSPGSSSLAEDLGRHIAAQERGDDRDSTSQDFNPAKASSAREK